MQKRTSVPRRFGDPIPARRRQVRTPLEEEPIVSQKQDRSPAPTSNQPQRRRELPRQRGCRRLFIFTISILLLLAGWTATSDLLTNPSSIQVSDDVKHRLHEVQQMIDALEHSTPVVQALQATTELVQQQMDGAREINRHQREVGEALLEADETGDCGRLSLVLYQMRARFSHRLELLKSINAGIDDVLKSIDGAVLEIERDKIATFESYSQSLRSLRDVGMPHDVQLGLHLLTRGWFPAPATSEGAVTRTLRWERSLEAYTVAGAALVAVRLDLSDTTMYHTQYHQANRLLNLPALQASTEQCLPCENGVVRGVKCELRRLTGFGKLFNSVEDWVKLQWQQWEAGRAKTTYTDQRRIPA